MSHVSGALRSQRRVLDMPEIGSCRINCQVDVPLGPLELELWRVVNWLMIMLGTELGPQAEEPRAREMGNSSSAVVVGVWEPRKAFGWRLR